MRGVDLMSTLFGANLDELRDAFLVHDGVDSNEFVRLLLHYCPQLRHSAKKSHVQRLPTIATPARSHAADPDGSLDNSYSSVDLRNQPANSDFLEVLGDEGRDAVLQLFHSIDCDGDGVVTWEEVYNFAISSTMLRLEPRPSERIRPYAIASKVPREDNLYMLQHFRHLDMVCVSSRHKPLQLLDVETFKPVLSAKPSDFAVDVAVTCAAHAPGPDVVTAFTSDLVLHSWTVIDRRFQALPTVVSDEYLSCMQVPDTQPSTLFAGTSVGTLKLFDLSRHYEPRLKFTIPVHSTRSGDDFGHSFQRRGAASKDIITCFTFISPFENRVVSAGFDQRLCITDLNVVDAINAAAVGVDGLSHDAQPNSFLSARYNNTRRSPTTGGAPSGVLPPGVTCIGMSDSVPTHLAYNEHFQLIFSASMDGSVSAWVPHSSHSPKTVLNDVVTPHRRRLVGLCCVPNTPQVISTDEGGMVKVWDARTFGCTQTLRLNNPDAGAAGDVDGDVAAVGGSASGGGPSDAGRAKGGRRRACGMVYAESAQKLVVADSDGITTLEYDPGANPTLADEQIVLSILCNPYADTFVTMTSAAIGVWDADLGVLRSHHRLSAGKVDLTVSCLDDRCRRLLVGASDGTVRVFNYHGMAALRHEQVHSRDVTGIFYCDVIKTIVSIGLDGVLGMWREKDQGAPIERYRLNIGALTALACSTPLSVVIVGSDAGKVAIVDMQHPRVSLGEVSGPAAVRCVTILGNLPLFAVGYANGLVAVYSCRPALETVCVHSFFVAERQAPPTATPTPASSWDASTDPLRQQSATFALGSATTTPQTGINLMFTAQTSESLQPTNASRDDGSLHAGGDVLSATTIRFDEVAHSLWVGDSAGFVSSWAFCVLLQTLRMAPATFPNSPVFHIEPPNPAPPVPLLTSLRVHRDEVVTLEVMRDHGCLCSAGDDRRVTFFDADGKSFGELCFGRKAPDGGFLVGGSPATSQAGSIQLISPSRRRRVLARRAAAVQDEPVMDHYDVCRVHRPTQAHSGVCNHAGMARDSAKGEALGEPNVVCSLGDDQLDLTTPLVPKQHRDSVYAMPRLIGDLANAQLQISPPEPGDERNLPTVGLRPTETPRFSARCVKLDASVGLRSIANRSSVSDTPSLGGTRHVRRHHAPTGWRLVPQARTDPLDSKDASATAVHLSTLLGYSSKAFQQRQRLEAEQLRSREPQQPTQATGLPTAATGARSPARRESIQNSPRQITSGHVAEEKRRPSLPRNLVFEPVSDVLLQLHDAPHGAAIRRDSLLPPAKPPRSPGRRNTAADDHDAPAPTEQSTNVPAPPVAQREWERGHGAAPPTPARVPEVPEGTSVPAPRPPTRGNAPSGHLSRGRPTPMSSVSVGVDSVVSAPSSARSPRSGLLLRSSTFGIAQVQTEATALVVGSAPPKGGQSSPAHSARVTSATASPRELPRPSTSDFDEHNPRRRLVLGHAKLGRDLMGTKSEQKPDKHEVRQRAFENELKSCLLGGRKQSPRLSATK
jgi:WD40 repeat protein